MVPFCFGPASESLVEYEYADILLRMRGGSLRTPQPLCDVWPSLIVGRIIAQLIDRIDENMYSVRLIAILETIWN